jgi:hypothetical protein
MKQQHFLCCSTGPKKSLFTSWSLRKPFDTLALPGAPKLSMSEQNSPSAAENNFLPIEILCIQSGSFFKSPEFF